MKTNEKVKVEKAKISDYEFYLYKILEKIRLSKIISELDYMNLKDFLQREINK